jgi:uncharacterized protein YacL
MEYIYLTLLCAILIEVSLLLYNGSKDNSKNKNLKPIFLDTSVLIDGRILALIDAGLLRNDVLNIPRSVVRELQMLADGSDNDKRAKARGGLDNVSKLQSNNHIKTVIFDDGIDAKEGVDERLLNLSKKYKGILCTVDFNLLKVADIEKIPSININDLAKNLRIVHLPGEIFYIDLTQKGNDQNQAVGYLSDGTMVVVEDSKNLIGKTIEVECTRSLQTSAGRMIFARQIRNGKNKFNRFKK